MASGSDIPIGHLDYDYIKDCTDAVELEKIITVLRFVFETACNQQCIRSVGCIGSVVCVGFVGTN